MPSMLALVVVLLGAGNTRITSLHEAKKRLLELYVDHPVTLYSQCSFFTTRKTVDYRACDYVPRHHTKRAYRIEWEHVVPAEAFGRRFDAWRVGHPRCLDRHGTPFRGRHCAAAVDHAYRLMEADMYNLVPEIGEVNELRSNHPMGEVPRAAPYTLARLTARLMDDTFDPGPSVRGDVARIHLYMDRAYPEVRLLDDARRTMFERWAAADPVDAWECARARHVAVVQGNANPLMDAACAGARGAPASPER